MSGYCAAPGCAPYRPRRTDGVLCEWCQRNLGDALDAIPDHYRELERELPRTAKRGELVSGTRSPQPPLRVHILDAMTDTARLLTGWEDTLRAAYRLTDRRTDVREHVAVVRAKRFLRTQLGRIVDDTEHAPGFAADILQCRARLGRVLGWGELRHRLPAPCPHCDELALTRFDGDSYVRCVACRAAWHESEYAHLVLVLTEGTRRVSR